MTLSYALSLSLGGHSNTHRRDPSSPTLRHPYSPRSTPLLAETWEPSSLSRLACIPYYKHSGCKIIQCPRTPPLLDLRPRGRNQDKSCVTVLPLASSSGTRKHAAFTSWDPGPRVGTPTMMMIIHLHESEGYLPSRILKRILELLREWARMI